MSHASGVDRIETDRALGELLEAGLVEFRPWRPGGVNGVWQLVPVPRREGEGRVRGLSSVAEVLKSLGLAPP